MSRRDLAGLAAVFAMSAVAWIVCYGPLSHWP
jgi:hypothetical protein